MESPRFALEIDNTRWLTEEGNRGRIEVVTLRNSGEPNFNGMQGRRYAGKRQGGAVIQPGPAVATWSWILGFGLLLVACRYRGL